MRISCLDSHVIRIARDALLANHADWGTYFLPDFRPPPAPVGPGGIDQAEWPRIAEHVARAERVSQYIREHGLDAALERFGDSSHAIEHATLVAAAVQVEAVSLEILARLLACEIDELVAYGSFLDLLYRVEVAQQEPALAVYEQFYRAFVAKSSQQSIWHERVRLVRDGLAGFYVHCGRYEAGHMLFLQCHAEDSEGLIVALAASRAFLAAGSLSHAIMWLGMGAERAQALGRGEMAATLRTKQAALKSRQS